MGLRAQLLGIVLQDLPEATSVLSESSERWDALHGGRTGPNSWKRYARHFGTDCGVVCDGWMIDAQVPAELINAEESDGGSGWKVGDHLARLVAGARQLGWLRSPERGKLPTFRPGDVYLMEHTTVDGSYGGHVGVIISVTPQQDGSLDVETADGGQGTLDRQLTSRSLRTFRIGSGQHIVSVQSPHGTGWLDYWVAIGGDEVEAPSESPDESQGSGGLIFGAGVVAVALVIAGLTLYGMPKPEVNVSQLVDQELTRRS